MWFASIWIFTLRLPWELGANFFWRHLFDGDAAANTLSWRWVAGLHTPGKLYLARADNIARYTEGRYCPEGLLATTAQAVVEPPLEEPGELWTAEDPRVAPKGPVGLWLHPEDLSVETANLGGLTPAGVLALWPEVLASTQQWAGPVVTFTQAALSDGASRAALAWDTECRAERTAEPGEAAVAWARGLGLRTVVALRPMVGPWLDMATEMQASLRRAGIALRWYRREWDTTLFPAARRGFFPFWDAAVRLHLPVEGPAPAPEAERQEEFGAVRQTPA
jgi:deoxyribodipyrimidine photo-lyase